MRLATRTFGVAVCLTVCGAALVAATMGAPQQAPGAQAITAKGRYFGQAKPGATPELFAPDVVAAMQMTRSPVFVAGGDEVFWSTSVGPTRGLIMQARLGPDGWTKGEPLPFSTGEFFDHNPAPSADGRRLVFASNRPIPGKPATTMPGTSVPTSDLWMSARTSGGWTVPVPLDPEINTAADDDVPVLTRDGTLYFGSSRPGAPGPGAIYHSRFVGGRFAPPVLLPAPITTAAGEMLNYVAPDESYIIYYSMQQGSGGGLHVSFRRANRSWGQPVKVGDVLASLRGYFLTVSPDGEALFFTSAAKGGVPRIYWVDAKVIHGLRASADQR